MSYSRLEKELLRVLTENDRQRKEMDCLKKELEKLRRYLASTKPSILDLETTARGALRLLQISKEREHELESDFEEKAKQYDEAFQELTRQKCEANVLNSNVQQLRKKIEENEKISIEYGQLEVKYQGLLSEKTEYQKNLERTKEKNLHLETRMKQTLDALDFEKEKNEDFMDRLSFFERQLHEKGKDLAATRTALKDQNAVMVNLNEDLVSITAKYETAEKEKKVLASKLEHCKNSILEHEEQLQRFKGFDRYQAFFELHRPRVCAYCTERYTQSDNLSNPEACTFHLGDYVFNESNLRFEWSCCQRTTRHATPCYAQDLHSETRQDAALKPAAQSSKLFSYASDLNTISRGR